MEILLSTSNDIYKVTFNAPSKTLTISGVNNFPLDYTSIREIYDVTAAGDITPRSSALQFTWFRANDLPIFVYGFTRLPAGAANADVLNILLDIPQNQSILSLQQFQATASGGVPGTLAAGETPTGVIDGVNTTFTLAFTPITGAITIFYVQPNFQPSQFLNYTADFKVVGNVVTFLTAPVVGSSIFANYYH
jgi:hypothetical protein